VWEVALAEFTGSVLRVAGAVVMAYGIYRHLLGSPRRAAWLLLLIVGGAVVMLATPVSEWVMRVMQDG
jgi:hypothetical protein